MKDVHMFPRLRHDPFIRGDDKQDQVHADDAGNHIVDKLFMARNIDDAGTVSVRKVKIGESEVDRYASPLLFLPPVCIAACQSLNQRGLSMVYVPGSAYNNVLHNQMLLNVMR